MPELPDIAVYLEALETRVLGRRLLRIRLVGPSLLKSFDPPLADAHNKTVTSLERLGKRIVFGLEGDLYLVLHLMIAGRLHWRDPGAAVPRKVGLAAFDFPNGTLTLTEAATRKRASLFLVQGREALSVHDRGGLEVAGSGPAGFAAVLRSENHTLKRSLTDPGLFSGIGNAYSDEILHRARLSPLALSARLTDEEVTRLHTAAVEILAEWTDRLREDTGEAFPEKVTAFRKEMAVHGKFGRPCPVCGSPVQRIVYASNETNYCPTCQTGGKLLADRSLSRILKNDWPRNLDELEELHRGPGSG